MKNGGRIPWSVTAICELGNNHMKGGSECPLMDQKIPFGAMVEYHPISARDISRIHQFGPKVLPGLFLGYVLYAGANLERRHYGPEVTL